jgi:predicted dehydrogenase
MTPSSGRAASRRDFMKTAAAAAAGVTIVPRHVLGRSRQAAPSDRLAIAGIGVGGMGAANLSAMETEDIVALCDVDENYAAPTFKKYPAAKVYKDFRVMLEKEKGIDAVLVATPDHTHAVITMAAMHAGKHVYCQKPLTHTVEEARRLARAAREAKVVTQMGNQGRSGVGAKLLSAWVHGGVIGRVREVHAWCSLTYYPWGHQSWSSPLGRKPKETPPVPPGLDWDLWLGPAPWRDYHPCYHPASWRAWWDFGCGMMGDRGVHTLGPVCWALDLRHPRSVSASVSDLNEDTHPIAAVVTYDFEARGAMPPVKLVWYEGLEPPRPDALEDGRKLPAEGGCLLFGERGTIVAGVYGESPQLLPYARMKDAPRLDEAALAVPPSHEQDWIASIKQGRKAGSDFSESGPLTEFVLLGNIAKRTQSKLAWDPEAMRITNDVQASLLLSAPGREGWSLNSF